MWIKNLLILLSISITIATRPRDVYNDSKEPQLKKLKHDSSVNLENVLEQQDHLDTFAQFLECSDCNSLSQINKDTNQRVKGFNVPNKLKWLQDFLLSNKAVDYGAQIILNWAIKQPNLPFKKGHDWVQLAFDKKLYLLTDHLLDLNMKPNNPELLFNEALKNSQCGIIQNLYENNWYTLKANDVEMALEHDCHDFLIHLFKSNSEIPPFNIHRLFFESLRRNSLILAEEIVEYVSEQNDDDDDIDRINHNLRLQTHQNLNYYQSIFKQFFLNLKKVWDTGKLPVDRPGLISTAFFAGDQAGITMTYIIEITLYYEWYEFMEQLVFNFIEDDYNILLHYLNVIEHRFRSAIRFRNADLYMRIIKIYASSYFNNDRPVNWNMNTLEIQYLERDNLIAMSTQVLRPWIESLFVPMILASLPQSKRWHMAMFDPRNEESIVKHFQEGLYIFLDSSSISDSEKKLFSTLFDEAFLKFMTELRVEDIFEHDFVHYIEPWLKHRLSDQIFISTVIRKALNECSSWITGLYIIAFLKASLTECDEKSAPEYFVQLIPQQHSLMAKIHDYAKIYCDGVSHPN